MTDQQRKNAGFPITTEQFICPGCDSSIPQAHVLTDYVKGGFEPARLITTVCPHCNAVHRGTFKLRGGMWHLEGNVERVESPKQLRPIRRRVDDVLNTHLAQAS